MRILFYLLVCLLSCLTSLSAQTNWTAQLQDAYPRYRDKNLTDRRFKPSDIASLVQALGSPFKVQEEGQSVEGRPIFSIRFGTGSTTVLLWSQMHGDEPTATAALMDILCFFQATNDGFDVFRNQLLKDLTIVLVPILNPDGAEVFERRNALGIDINRDALRLTSPEARLLKRLRDELQADWGFNLHDQNRFYGAGYPTKQMATLSLLAPAYNSAREVNPVRQRAMQLVALLNNRLQPFAPRKIARYNDAFEPRAFGDNMQKWGTSTVLIESGGYPDDREKQYIRQLNFVGILSALHAIGRSSYQNFTVADYNKIPYNRSGLFNDLLLREVRYTLNNESYLLDIAFDRDEEDYNAARAFYYQGKIRDVGDLSLQQAYEELPPSGYTVEIGKCYPTLLPTLTAVRQLDANALLREGYAVVRVEKPGPTWDYDNDSLWIVGAEGYYDQTLQPGANPPLLLRNTAGSVVYAVINGQLIQVD